MTATTPHTPHAPATIALYGPKAVGLGVGASIVAALFGGGLALAAGAQGESLMGGVVAAGLLAGTWALAWGVAALTGPYRPATAGMAWLALSTTRLMILVVAGIALALAAPTMGLGLWLAMLAGGLASVVVDSAMAVRAFRQPAGTHAGATAAPMDAPMDSTSGGTR